MRLRAAARTLRAATSRLAPAPVESPLSARRVRSGVPPAHAHAPRPVPVASVHPGSAGSRERTRGTRRGNATQPEIAERRRREGASDSGRAPTAHAPSDRASSAPAPTDRAPSVRASSALAPTAHDPSCGRAPTARVPSARDSSARAPIDRAPSIGRNPTAHDPSCGRAPTARAPSVRASSARDRTDRARSSARPPTARAPSIGRDPIARGRSGAGSIAPVPNAPRSNTTDTIVAGCRTTPATSAAP